MANITELANKIFETLDSALIEKMETEDFDIPETKVALTVYIIADKLNGPQVTEGDLRLMSETQQLDAVSHLSFLHDMGKVIEGAIKLEEPVSQVEALRQGLAELDSSTHDLFSIFNVNLPMLNSTLALRQGIVDFLTKEYLRK